MYRMACVLGVFFGGLWFYGCGPGDHGTARVTLEKGRVSVGYKRIRMGEKDPIESTHEGYVVKMGADALITLKTDTDLLFDTVIVRKGEYSLWIHRGLTWWLVINRALPRDSKYDMSADAAIIPFHHVTEEKRVVPLTIRLSGEGNRGRLGLEWGVHRFHTSFTAVTGR